MDRTAAFPNITDPLDPRDQHVLIVGASAAGLSTAEALRRNGHRGRLTLLDAESRLPYDRPPLSKQVLSGEWISDRAALRDQEMLDSLDASFLLGEAATSLHVATRTVITESGREIAADAIVLATGLRARHLPAAGGADGREAPAGVYVLRTLDDAHRLKEALATSSKLVVVGNGVLGCEIAATASARRRGHPCWHGRGADGTPTGPARVAAVGGTAPRTRGPVTRWKARGRRENREWPGGRRSSNPACDSTKQPKNTCNGAPPKD